MCGNNCFLWRDWNYLKDLRYSSVERKLTSSLTKRWVPHNLVIDDVWMLLEKLKRTTCICLTMPHRALTAPWRVASLKSRLSPTCSAGDSGDWLSLSVTTAIVPLMELSENFPRYVVQFTMVYKPNPHEFVWALRGEESGIRWIHEEGRNLEREEAPWIQRNISGWPWREVHSQRRLLIGQETVRKLTNSFSNLKTNSMNNDRFHEWECIV